MPPLLCCLSKYFLNQLDHYNLNQPMNFFSNETTLFTNIIYKFHKNKVIQIHFSGDCTRKNPCLLRDSNPWSYNWQLLAGALTWPQTFVSLQMITLSLLVASKLRYIAEVTWTLSVVTLPRKCISFWVWGEVLHLQPWATRTTYPIILVRAMTTHQAWLLLRGQWWF